MKQKAIKTTKVKLLINFMTSLRYGASTYVSGHGLLYPDYVYGHTEQPLQVWSQYSEIHCTDTLKMATIII